MRLRVVTYNIHRAIGIDRRFRPERIAEILAAHEADVVLLQEVDDGVPRSRGLDLARELAGILGYPHLAVGHNVRLRKGRYGNATLSRHPILRERNIDLTIGIRKRRGCQHTTIHVQGEWTQDVEVFNLHLGLSARERGQQVGVLLGAREMAGVDSDRPAVVGGDTNDWRFLIHDAFLARDFQSATHSRTRPDRPLFTFPSFFPQGALDRVYYRGPLRFLGARRCPLLVSKVASDHLPVIVDFEILRSRLRA